MLVARGLPCPVGLVRGGRRTTLVVKVTLRLEGVNVWAATQAPLRETILDDSGRRVFPSDFQAHKSALDVVVAGATLNALGPIRLRVGRHQIFSEDPRSLGPVPLADAGRESSFARPDQQLPLQEYPLQLEVLFAAARTRLSVTAPPVHAALIVREDWSAPNPIPLNMDALLVDPMREVAELVFRGFFADTANALLVVGPQLLEPRAPAEAQRWPRAEALEPRARSVRETAYDLDEDTFVADADSDATIKLSSPKYDDESTAVRPQPKALPNPISKTLIHTSSPAVRAKTLALSAVGAEFTRVLAAMPAKAAELPFTQAEKPRTPSVDESTAVNLAVPAIGQSELPFTGDSTLLLRGGALKLGPDLPFATPTATKETLVVPAVAPPIQRSASRTMLGGEAGRALPFQGVGSATPRQLSVPPDAGLPFRHASEQSIPMAPPVHVAPSVPRSLVQTVPPALSTPQLVPSPAPAIVERPGASFLFEGLTLEQYAKIRSRLWQGEPRSEVLREHDLSDLRFRLLERKLQRHLDALPPAELLKVLELLG